MTCENCGDKGLTVLNWADAKPEDPPDFGLCLCEAGQALRRSENEGRRAVPLWQVWCAREQVDPSRVYPLERVFSEAELRAAGLVADRRAVDRDAALLAQGRKDR